MYTSTYLATLALASFAMAKTDLAGCTSSAVGASLLWYVPESGEICSILDCGGGRAPAKTTVPGCAAYVGTESYQPSFIPNYGEASATSVEAQPTETSSYEESKAYTASATATEFSESYAESTGASTLATITSAATLSQYPIGTGSSSVIVPSGGNNVTGTATLSSPASASASESGVPESTGAASLMAVAKGALGVVVGVVGLAVL